MKKIGFIGSGNMASAIMGGIIKKQIFQPEEIIASDLFEGAREKAKDNLGIFVTDQNKQVVKESEVLVLSVKPQFYEEVIREIKDEIRKDQIVITIAPGWTLEKVAQSIGGSHKIVRTMPNTPALVGEGITGVCPNSFVEKEDLDYVLTILSS